jgi:hypothetical protein
VATNSKKKSISGKDKKMFLFRNASALLMCRKLFPKKRCLFRYGENPSIPYKPHNANASSCLSPDSSSKICDTIEHTRRRSALPVLTKMECILYWLHKEGTDIKSQQNAQGETFYLLERRVLSPCQVIMIANRLRLSKGLALFFVETITQY